MQDEYLSQPQSSPRSRGPVRAILAVGLLSFVLGAVLMGWVAWRSGLTLDKVLGREPQPPVLIIPPVQSRAASAAFPANPALGQGGFDQRVATLEQRLARLNLQAEAASGNAARAEGLLIAFATRRMIDRGSPLGYLEEQLKVRFADAQPKAVATIITAAQRPVTLDQLAAELQAMIPALTQTSPEEPGWRRISREVSGLFVIRRENRPAQDPLSRVNRALLLLREGRIEAAIIEVRHLPGASGASGWIAAAQRYLTAQRALDLLESTALIESRRFSDGAGQKVETPSPLVPPAPAPGP